MNLLLAAAVAFSFGSVDVDCAKSDGWKLTVSREEVEPGVEIARLKLASDVESVPPCVTVKFLMPQVDVQGFWTLNDAFCDIRPDWGGRQKSEVAYKAPICAYINSNDRARMTIAADELIGHVEYRGGVREEGCVLSTEYRFLCGVEAPRKDYEVALRFDTRNLLFADSIREATAWMEQSAGIVTCPVPEAAFEPLYSAWYDFHQNVSAAEIEAECREAVKLGMRTLIVDDGWQTDDNNRGYAYCGDWQVSTNRFPDFAAHVAKVQQLGMKYMIWYSLPYMGHKAKAYERFRGKFLYDSPEQGTAALDPRFPEVREYLIGTYVRALREWNLDGFKLDFIDAFFVPEGKDPALKDDYAGRDYKSIPAAVNRLMTDVYDALSAIKPDILIEFRQDYNGPAIRRFGNMLRVGDCPGSMRQNRISIASMRLVAGNAAVHSDMLEWNWADTPESAARFIINSIFGVVQYSVMLREAPPEHKAMIEKWFRFSQDHRKTIFQGKFMPHHPELNYPLIEAIGEDEVVIGVYDDGRLVEAPADKRVFIMNATGRDRVTVRRGGVLRDVEVKSGDWVEL